VHAPFAGEPQKNANGANFERPLLCQNGSGGVTHGIVAEYQAIGSPVRCPNDAATSQYGTGSNEEVIHGGRKISQNGLM
jgi:hypothetical protein